MDLLTPKHKVFIYARGGEQKDDSSEKWNTKNVWRAKSYLMPNTTTYIDEDDFKQWLLSNNIETVLFNEQSWWQSVLLCKRLGIKAGAYIDYYTDSTIKLFAAYDFLICNTQRHYSAFSWHSQCYYIPWGTDTNLFTPDFKAKDKPPNKNDLTFFHSCGMAPFRKGTDLVLRAFYKLFSEKQKCSLLIHTQVNLLRLLPDLKALISEMTETKRLQIVEKSISAPGLYFMGDVYVYPSRLDGIGLTVPEALSSGLPVIVPDNKPMSEFVQLPSRLVEIEKYYCRSDGYYWPMCEVSIDELAKQMKFFVENSEYLADYKTETRTYAIEKLDWSKNAYDICRIFTESKPLTLKNSVAEKINRYDNRQFPFISKWPYFYSLLYRLVRLMKRLVS